MIRKPLSVGLIMMGGTLFGIYLLKIVLAGKVFPAIITIAGVAAAAWAVSSGDHYWFPALIALYGGGEVNLGFRVFLLEVAIAFTMATCVMRNLIGKAGAVKKRGSVPVSLWFLLAYLVLHMTASVVWAAHVQAEGMGSIARVYMYNILQLSLAAILLAQVRIPNPRLVVAVILIVSLARAGLDIASAAGLPVTIPGVPIALPAALLATTDLRSVGNMALPVTLALSSTALTLARRWASGFLGAGSFVAAAFGASRTGLINAAVIMLTFLVFRKKTLLATTVLAVIVAGVVVLNANPELLYSMPAGPRRAFLGTIVPSKFTDVQSTVEMSSRYHFDLMLRGFNRWVRNPATFAMGNVVKAPVYRAELDLTYEEILDRAVLMGNYESGLWSVLAVFGTIGGLLYFRVMWTIGKPVFSAVWRRGIATPTMALCFVAAAEVVEWVVFCPVAGGPPAQAVVLLAVAAAALREERPAGGEIPQGTGTPAPGNDARA